MGEKIIKIPEGNMKQAVHGLFAKVQQKTGLGDKKIDEFQPDLVTLDVMMPGLTTREILEKLREKKTKPRIILLTVVRYSDEEKQKLYQMGIIDYVTKPFELDTLFDTIHKHVMRSEMK